MLLPILKSTLRTDFWEVKSVSGLHVRLGNPDLDFENLNPDFPIERILRLCGGLCWKVHLCVFSIE